MKKALGILLLAIMPMVAACGGGGETSPMPTTAVITLSSQGTLPAGNGVTGFGATIELPAGVTAKTVTGGAADAAVVVPSGLLAGSAGTLGPVNYTPATATAKAKLDFTMASMVDAGAGVGEYATITLILSGVTPAVTDFNVTSFQPVDLSFSPIATLTSKLSLSTH